MFGVENFEYENVYFYCQIGFKRVYGDFDERSGFFELWDVQEQC